MKTLICGGPKTGKTTLSSKYSNVKHTDDLIETHEWSQASEEASRWLDNQNDYTVEGTAAIRALRKWKNNNPNKPPPIDNLIYLSKPKEQLNVGQQRMKTAVDNIYTELKPWLIENGVKITYAV